MTAKRVNDYIWIDPQEADWWITATMQSLQSYSTLFNSNADSSLIYRLILRHDCTVFAPFDGAATWDRLNAVVATMPSERQQRYQRYLADPLLDRTSLAEIDEVFWSWRLLNFANADGSIICTPMLGLWSDWPSSIAWAPPSLQNVVEKSQFTSEGVARLLNDVYWQRIETLFARARTACGLNVAEPEFGDFESRPPVFFFAAPADVPDRPEEYAESLRSAILPLVRSCLLSSDPLAHHTSWAVLEGNLVTLRRELAIARQSYEPRYLLLPAWAHSASSRPIEDDIAAIADRLTFLEFSIGHEARDVFTDIEPLAVRVGMWSGTLDLVNSVTGEAIDQLPSANRSELLLINDRLAAVHLALRHLQANIETAASDTDQVTRKYSSYLDSTDDYVRRTATYSEVPHVTTPNLGDAIQDAYPYHYLKQSRLSLSAGMSQLSDEVERTSNSLKTILDLSDRRLRALSSRLNGIGGAIIALLALLVGLAQVLGAQTIVSTTSGSAPSGNLIDQFFQSPELVSGARLLFELLVPAIVIAMGLFVVVWLYQRQRRRRHKFIEGVQRFRALVAAAEARLSGASPADADKVWRAVDQLDDEATQILADLWDELGQSLNTSGSSADTPLQKVHVQSVKEWEAHSRLLEHSIEIFDLAPRAIALPRALCVLRFKSSDFHRRTTVSDWDFSRSLRAVGYSTPEVELLTSWLTTPDNQQQVKGMTVAAFTQALKERGVTIVPDQHKPDQWHGAVTTSTAAVAKA